MNNKEIKSSNISQNKDRMIEIKIWEAMRELLLEWWSQALAIKG